MAAVAGTLAINIISRHAQAIAGMNKVGKRGKQLGGTFSNISKKVSAFAGSLGGAVTVAGAAAIAVGAFNRAIDSLVSTGDVAKKLGVDIEQLSRFHHAANIANVSVDTFNMASQRMVRRVSEAAHGTGEAREALKELGLEANALSELPLDQQMLAISRAMGEVDGQGNKVRLAMKLFDSEGVALVNMLGDGEASLKAVMAATKNVMTPEDEEKARAYKDAMTQLNDAWKAMATDIAPDVAIALIPVLKGLGELVGIAMDAANAFQRLAGYIKDALGPLVYLLPGGLIMDLFGDTEAGIKKVGDAATETGDKTSRAASVATAALGEQKTAAGDTAAAMADIGTEAEAASGKAVGAAARQVAAIRTIEDARRRLMDAGGTQDDVEIQHAGGKITRLQRKAGVSRNAGGSDAGGTDPALEAYMAKQEAHNQRILQMQAKQISATEDTTDATRDVAKEIMEAESVELVLGTL